MASSSQGETAGGAAFDSFYKELKEVREKVKENVLLEKCFRWRKETRI